MNKFIFLFLFLIPLISAECDSGQIDINSASLAELDEIYGIGPAYAQNIIDSRPYNTLDELVNAKGIGTITLENIKSQGLACVEGEEYSEPKEINEEKEKSFEEVTVKEKEEPIKEPETIRLNEKAFKTESSNENVGKDYPKYLIFLFCIILAFLYLKKSKKKKNEWR